MLRVTHRYRIFLGGHKNQGAKIEMVYPPPQPTRDLTLGKHHKFPSRVWVGALAENGFWWRIWSLKEDS